jgi:hypothetical protein
MAFEKNDFVRRLRELQQDGRGAISLPTDWLREPPLLEVSTPLDVEIEGIVRAVNDPTSQPRWHFLVGSPGNGKSAAIGKLVRRLHDNGWSFTDENKIPLEQIPSDQVPYVLHAYQTNQPYASIWIAQDASVVRNPYAQDVDPVLEFEELLRRAVERCVSLIVCTNRGVIEALFSKYVADPATRSQPWFSAIEAAVSGEPRSLKLPAGGKHDRAECASTLLDARSLVIRSDVFHRVIKRAVDDMRWDGCTRCDASNWCPFLQNRAWLQDPTRRDNFIVALRRAEVLSGRVIVFREALALLSLILSGCPHDHDSADPCAWVHAAVGKKDLFLLLSRRIYALVYSSHSPLGLERSHHLKTNQLSALQRLAQAGELPAVYTRLATDPLPSADVGIPSLLSADGILSELDPFAAPVPEETQQRWDQEANFVDSTRGGSALEQAAVTAWNCLREAAEIRGDLGGDVVSWLERWITAFTIRAAALTEGYTTFATELDELVSLLTSGEARTPDQARQLRTIEIGLNAALRAGSSGVRIAPYAELTGAWVDQNLKAKANITAQKTSDNLAFPVEIGSKFKVSIPGRAYAWLRYREARQLSLHTFPASFLTTARDALARAAAEGGYFWQEDDVVIRVTLPNGDTSTLQRVRGMAICDE